MQTSTGTSSGKNNKSCGIFHNESNKIGFAFVWFSYDFLRNLQISAKVKHYLRTNFRRGPWNFSAIHKYALGSHLGPWKYSRPRNWVPGTNGGGGSPESGGASGFLAGGGVEEV
jgi:hypothetical protein